MTKLWDRIGKKPAFMDFEEADERLKGIVLKTMQQWDEGRSMIDFNGFMSMVSRMLGASVSAHRLVCPYLLLSLLTVHHVSMRLDFNHNFNAFQLL